MNNYTVMGPELTLSDTTTSVANPPQLSTNKTNKIQYRDELKTWAEITRGLAKTDKKMNAVLETIGLIIYMTCNNEAKAKLRAEETEKRLNLRGDEDGPQRFRLIEQIINAIAYEPATENIQREVNMLNDIQQCGRENKEPMEVYTNKFDANLSRYIDQKKTRTPTEDQKWELLLLQNGKLTPDSKKALTFQLTTMAAMRNENVKHSTIPLHIDELTRMTNALDSDDRQKQN